MTGPCPLAAVKLRGSRKHVALVDAADLEAVQQHRWRFFKGSKSRTRRTFYAVTNIDSKLVYLHLFLWRRWGEPPCPIVDHRDGNGLHCWRKNLRGCRVIDNNRNRGPLVTNTSGFKGVCWHKRMRKWTALIGVDGRRLYLGGWDSAETAARAYDQAALTHHGAFAVLNFP